MQNITRYFVIMMICVFSISAYAEDNFAKKGTDEKKPAQKKVKEKGTKKKAKTQPAKERPQQRPQNTQGKPAQASGDRHGGPGGPPPGVRGGKPAMMPKNEKWTVSTEFNVFDNGYNNDASNGVEFTIEHLANDKRNDFGISHFTGENENDERIDRSVFGLKYRPTDKWEIGIAGELIRNHTLHTDYNDGYAYVTWRPLDWRFTLGIEAVDDENLNDIARFLVFSKEINKHFEIIGGLSVVDLEEANGPFAIVEEDQFRYQIGGLIKQLPHRFFVLVSATESDDEDKDIRLNVAFGQHAPMNPMQRTLSYIVSYKHDSGGYFGIGVLSYGKAAELIHYSAHGMSKGISWSSLKLPELSYKRRFEFGPINDERLIDNGIVLEIVSFKREIMEDIHVGATSAILYYTWTTKSDIFKKIFVGTSYTEEISPVAMPRGLFSEETEDYMSYFAGVYMGKKRQWQLRAKYTPDPITTDDHFTISLSYDFFCDK